MLQGLLGLTRLDLAEAAVTAERVRAADSLRAAIGDRLAEAAGQSAAALQSNGSALLLVPSAPGWVAFAAVIAGLPALWAAKPWTGLTTPDWLGGMLFLTVDSAALGLLVFGLTRLAQLAVQLENLRGELARKAVAGERLRLARDTHDLLGLGLSAIAMKADLIGKLIGRDDARAGEEIAELARICATARAQPHGPPRSGGRGAGRQPGRRHVQPGCRIPAR